LFVLAWLLIFIEADECVIHQQRLQQDPVLNPEQADALYPEFLIASRLILFDSVKRRFTNDKN